MSERCSIRVAWTGDRSDTPSTSSVGCRSMGSCGASKPFRREKILTEWRNYLYTLYQYNTCNYAPNNPFVSPLEINGQGVPYYMWCMFLEGHNDSKSRYICRHDPPKQKKKSYYACSERHKTATNVSHVKRYALICTQHIGERNHMRVHRQSRIFGYIIYLCELQHYKNIT